MNKEHVMQIKSALLASALLLASTSIASAASTFMVDFNGAPSAASLPTVSHLAGTFDRVDLTGVVAYRPDYQGTSCIYGGQCPSVSAYLYIQVSLDNGVSWGPLGNPTAVELPMANPDGTFGVLPIQPKVTIPVEQRLAKALVRVVFVDNNPNTVQPNNSNTTVTFYRN